MRHRASQPVSSHSRAFTLAEVLLSLALLSGLATAIASWTVSTARTVAEVTEPLAWNAASESTLDRIGRDLATGDFALPDEKKRTDGPLPLLRASWSKDGVLAIQTRADGPCVRNYSIDLNSGALSVREQSTLGGEPRDRIMVSGVESFACGVDEKLRTVDVTIVGLDGQRAERSYRVQ